MTSMDELRLEANAARSQLLRDVDELSRRGRGALATGARLGHEAQVVFGVSLIALGVATTIGIALAWRR